MTDSIAGTRPAHLPEKPSLDGLEDRWTGVWQEQDTYAFDRARAASLPREQLFTIDTPPPTASGSLHVGHVFGYTQADCMARYKRMTGADLQTGIARLLDSMHGPGNLMHEFMRRRCRPAHE